VFGTLWEGKGRDEDLETMHVLSAGGVTIKIQHVLRAQRLDHDQLVRAGFHDGLVAVEGDDHVRMLGSRNTFDFENLWGGFFVLHARGGYPKRRMRQALVLPLLDAVKPCAFVSRKELHRFHVLCRGWLAVVVHHGVVSVEICMFVWVCFFLEPRLEFDPLAT